MQNSGPKFDLSGGLLCLDFSNTLEGRLKPEPQDLLRSFADLIAFGRQSSVLSKGDAERMAAYARQHPSSAQAVWQRAVRLRDALYELFLAIAQERAPAAADLQALNAELSKTAGRVQLERRNNHFDWEWADKDAMDFVLWRVARSAAELLTSNDLPRVRECEAGDCAWLFLDVSRNRSRRWCAMKSCGNREKVRRFYERHKTSAG